MVREGGAERMAMRGRFFFEAFYTLYMHVAWLPKPRK